MKTALYTAYHAPAPFLQSDSVIPIHVGRALSKTPLPGMIGDDTGDNISQRNPSYCELTALYWAWKNDHTSTHLGLMHYRRVLDFDNIHSNLAENFVDRFDIPTWTAQAEDWIARHPDVDVVIPRNHTMGRSVANNYRASHQVQDFDAARAIIAAHHPDDLAVFDAVTARPYIRLGNMFMMRRALFEEYCTWLFGILEKLEDHPLDRATYSVQQHRYIGFIAERLLTVWIEKIKTTQPELNIHEVGILSMGRAIVTPYLDNDSLNGPAHVNLAFAADRAYLPHTAAMVQSLLAHADPDRHYNLFFLHSGIAATDLALLDEVVTRHPGATLHRLNVGGEFDDSYRSASRSPSNATYNRFLLFDLLPGLDRLLYVDVDMIFRGDVAAIFDTDMGTHPLGAVTDFIMTRTLTGPTPTVDPNVPDLYQYHRDVLGLNDDQIGRYFNAGLLLFNFKAMDAHATGQTLMKMTRKGRYMFRDQDILNAHFKGKVASLDPRYNVFNTVLEGYGRVPRANHALAMAARCDPVVIHYAAGDYKPWNAAPVPMANHYWQAIAHTPFYAEVLSRLHKRPARQANRKKGLVVRTGMTLAERVPALRPALLRINAGLRKFFQ